MTLQTNRFKQTKKKQKAERFFQKKFFEIHKQIHKNFTYRSKSLMLDFVMESLILAQNKRWRRA